MTKENNSQGWIQDLSERRFVQYALTYIAVAWGLIQAIDWAVKRYDLNHSLVDAALIFFIAFLPAIMLFIYNHGRPGRDQWQPIEKIGIPLNLAIAIAVAGFIGYSSAEAEPITETIEIVDEDGAIEERVVFNRSLNNRLMIFPTTTEGLKGEDEWLNLAIPILQEADLEQDPRITAINPIGLAGAIADYNKELLGEISFSIKRKIAEDRNVDNFIVTTCSKAGSNFNVNYKVFNTKDGKEIFSKEYINSDLFAIVDGFSSGFNQFLYSKLGEVEGIEEFADLPVRDLKTDNYSALINYVQARYTSRIQNDLPSSITFLDKAIEADPEFMSAYYEKGSMLAAQRNITDGLANFDKASQLFAGQPERTTLGIKTQKYLYQNEVEKASRVGEMWQKLYPQNSEAYSILNLIYSVQGEFDKRIELWQSGYDAGHKSNFLIELGNLYTQKGEYDKAEKFYEEYQQLYPSKQGEVSQLGDLYLKQGKFDKAIEYFENILIVDEQKIDNHINVARAYLRKADFNKSLSVYNNALAIAKTPQDSFSIYSNLNNYYITKGEARKFLDSDAMRINLYAKFAPPIAVDGQYYNFVTIDRYRQCSGLDILKPELDRIGKETTIADIDWECVIQLNYGLGAEDKDALNGAFETCPEDIEKAIGPLQKLLIYGLRDYINGDHEKSLAQMNEYIEKSGQPRQEMLYFIAKINNAAGKYEENITEINNYLKTDASDADAIFKLAKAYKGVGNTKKAKEELQKALEIWKDADEAFIPAQQARKLVADI